MENNLLPVVGDSLIEFQIINRPLKTVAYLSDRFPLAIREYQVAWGFWFPLREDFLHRGGHEGFPGVLVFRVINVDSLLIEIQIVASEGEYLGGPHACVEADHGYIMP